MMQPAARRELVLRAAGAGDAGFVAELARTAFGEYGEYERVLPHWLGARGVSTVIAERRGEPVGFAMLGMRPGLHLARPDAELLALAVVEPMRRRGVGAALLREIVGVATRWRVRGVRLHTADTNHAAQRLFAREGFVRQASQEGFYPNGQGAVAMRRLLERQRLFRRR